MENPIFLAFESALKNGNRFFTQEELIILAGKRKDEEKITDEEMILLDAIIMPVESVEE